MPAIATIAHSHESGRQPLPDERAERAADNEQRRQHSAGGA